MVFNQCVRRFLPLALRRARTLRPLLSAILLRKPCSFLRWSFLGWYVRSMKTPPYECWKNSLLRYNYSLSPEDMSIKFSQFFYFCLDKLFFWSKILFFPAYFAHFFSIYKDSLLFLNLLFQFILSPWFFIGTISIRSKKEATNCAGWRFFCYYFFIKFYSDYIWSSYW